jgi:DnaK suppressor protein
MACTQVHNNVEQTDERRGLQVSTKNKYEELRKQLEEDKIHVSRELEQIKAAGQTMDNRREGSPFGKREEEATEAMELEKRLTMERKLNDQLAAVEHALDKFEKGTYGICDICGQPIEQARLEARPQSTVCMKCKSGPAKDA